MFDAALPGRKEKSATLIGAFKNGGPVTWLSSLMMGLGNLFAGQILRGLLFLAAQVGFAVYMLTPQGGLHYLRMLPGLGEQAQGKVWNEAEGIYEYVLGDQSQLILLYGLVAVLLSVTFALIWRWSVIDGYRALAQKRAGGKADTMKAAAKRLLDSNIHTLLMTPPLAALLIFTVTPLVYMMCMAFTNYSTVGGHLVLFDWVGFENFRNILSFGSAAGREFWGVLSWTLVWACFATFLNFLLGTLLAMVINRKSTRLKGFWRGCLCVTIAVPQFVSLLAIRTMLQENGVVNMLLEQWGLIPQDTALPFFTNTTWARASVILINLWVGIPYTILQVTGILKNVPTEQYEAARLDGAGAVQQFRKITLPYMLFVMTPYLITQFTTNINNFNVIYLLTGGAPQSIENTAGSTDLLITWLYKLSVDQQKYNMAAVIGILTFLVLSVVSLVTYRSSGSYKNEEGYN
ncbi:MAG: sugar ABC transporter permease [Ruminococcaceae bacterium]|nr:sugar ABC transporter permease [Oscillospiraceae bacterium]